MPQPTVRDIQQTFEEHPTLAPAIKKLLETAVSERGYDFQEEAIQHEATMLLSFSILEERSGYRPVEGPDKKKVSYFIINFKSFLVCYVMLELVQEHTGQALPDDPLAAIQFIQRFLEHSQAPDYGHRWYGRLDDELVLYTLIWLNQARGVPVLPEAIRQAKLLADARGSMDLAFDEQRTLDIIKLIDTAQEAVPYMEDHVEHIFELHVNVRESLHFNSFKDSILALIAEKPEKAAALFAYMDGVVWKQKKTVYIHLLVWLYETNPAYYFERALQFFTTDNENGAWIFANLKYSSLAELQQVYQLPVNRKQKVEVIANLVANTHCSAELRAAIFRDFLEMAKESLAHEDEWEEQVYQTSLVFNVCQLHGFDEEKSVLFPVYRKLYAPVFYWEWFQYAESPDGFFRAIREIYEEEGVEADLSKWASACREIQEVFPGEFTVFLYELLASEWVYGRKAAEVLTAYL